MAINSFKSDESFLEKLAVGAVGANATINRLKELSYQPVELERGSTGYKIWKKIKIKRVRVPDILCLRSGRRIESRGKTKLEISMSHSLKDPHRAWDAGMRSDDLAAFFLCVRADNTPVNWKTASPIHFIKIEELRIAYDKGHIQITKPKGVEEGSEIRVIWPCATAHEDAFVTEISMKSIKLTYLDGSGHQRCSLMRRGFSLLAQCQVGEKVSKNQIIASTVPISLDPVCETDVDEQFFIERLQSASLSERYAAAKALRFRGDKGYAEKLHERMVDPAEDIYVQLESAAALAIHEDLRGWSFLLQAANHPYLTVQLETVIVLSEIPLKQSEQLLINILKNPDFDSDVRAGAAWGLSEFRTQEAAQALIDVFNLANLEIKIEAARALLKITPPQIEYLTDALKTIDPDKRDGIAWALARNGGFDINDLLTNEADDNLRKWISYIAGYGKNQFTEEQISALCRNDPEIYFTACVLWQVLDSWIYNLGEY